MTLSLQTFKPISKMVWGLAKPKLEREQWIIAALKGIGIDLLKPDFKSIYAHALVAYTYDIYPEDSGKVWVDFFSLKESAEYIKAHLYQKPEEDLENKLGGLLNTGQGKTFLELKNIHAQTSDVMVEYQKLKKFLDEYTVKSRNPSQNQQFELSKELLSEVKALQLDLLEIKQVNTKEALITFDDTELLLRLEEIQEFSQQNQGLLQVFSDKLEQLNSQQKIWEEWIKQFEKVKFTLPEKPQINIEQGKNVITNTQIGDVSGDFIVGDNNKSS